LDLIVPCWSMEVVSVVPKGNGNIVKKWSKMLMKRNEAQVVMAVAGIKMPLRTGRPSEGLIPLIN
jgi:hypothetical protein